MAAVVDWAATMRWIDAAGARDAVWRLAMARWRDAAAAPPAAASADVAELLAAARSAAPWDRDEERAALGRWMRGPWVPWAAAVARAAPADAPQLAELLRLLRRAAAALRPADRAAWLAALAELLPALLALDGAVATAPWPAPLAAAPADGPADAADLAAETDAAAKRPRVVPTPYPKALALPLASALLRPREGDGPDAALWQRDWAAAVFDAGIPALKSAPDRYVRRWLVSDALPAAAAVLCARPPDSWHMLHSAGDVRRALWLAVRAHRGSEPSTLLDALTLLCVSADLFFPIPREDADSSDARCAADAAAGVSVSQKVPGWKKQFKADKKRMGRSTALVEPEVDRSSEFRLLAPRMDTVPPPSAVDLRLEPDFWAMVCGGLVLESLAKKQSMYLIQKVVQCSTSCAHQMRESIVTPAFSWRMPPAAPSPGVEHARERGEVRRRWRRGEASGAAPAAADAAAAAAGGSNNISNGGHSATLAVGSRALPGLVSGSSPQLLDMEEFAQRPPPPPLPWGSEAEFYERLAMILDALDMFDSHLVPPVWACLPELFPDPAYPAETAYRLQWVQALTHIAARHGNPKVRRLTMWYLLQLPTDLLLSLSLDFFRNLLQTVFLEPVLFATLTPTLLTSAVESCAFVIESFFASMDEVGVWREIASFARTVGDAATGLDCPAGDLGLIMAAHSVLPASRPWHLDLPWETVSEALHQLARALVRTNSSVRLHSSRALLWGHYLAFSETTLARFKLTQTRGDISAAASLELTWNVLAHAPSMLLRPESPIWHFARLQVGAWAAADGQLTATATSVFRTQNALPFALGCAHCANSSGVGGAGDMVARLLLVAADAGVSTLIETALEPSDTISDEVDEDTIRCLRLLGRTLDASEIRGPEGAVVLQKLRNQLAQLPCIEAMASRVAALWLERLLRGGSGQRHLELLVIEGDATVVSSVDAVFELAVFSADAAKSASEDLLDALIDSGPSAHMQSSCSLMKTLAAMVPKISSAAKLDPIAVELLKRLRRLRVPRKPAGLDPRGALEHNRLLAEYLAARWTTIGRLLSLGGGEPYAVADIEDMAEELHLSVIEARVELLPSLLAALECLFRTPLVAVCVDADNVARLSVACSKVLDGAFSALTALPRADAVPWNSLMNSLFAPRPALWLEHGEYVDSVLRIWKKFLRWSDQRSLGTLVRRSALQLYQRFGTQLAHPNRSSFTLHVANYVGHPASSSDFGDGTSRLARALAEACHGSTAFVAADQVAALIADERGTGAREIAIGWLVSVAAGEAPPGIRDPFLLAVTGSLLDDAETEAAEAAAAMACSGTSYRFGTPECHTRLRRLQLLCMLLFLGGPCLSVLWARTSRLFLSEGKAAHHRTVRMFMNIALFATMLNLPDMRTHLVRDLLPDVNKSPSEICMHLELAAYLLAAGALTAAQVEFTMRHIAACAASDHATIRAFAHVVVHKLVRVSAMRASVVVAGVDGDGAGVAASVLRDVSAYLDLNVESRKLMSRIYAGAFLPYELPDLFHPLFLFAVIPSSDDELVQESVTLCDFEAALAIFGASSRIPPISTTALRRGYDSLDPGSSAPAAHSAGLVENASDGIAVRFQRKVLPWELGVHSEDFQKVRQNATRSNLVVVASLVRKMPNLGGLARTCEIFNCESLVIDNRRILTDPAFLSLSVNAEHWLPIVEAPAADIASFLALKRADGYTIVGLEQTSDSVPLHQFHFPARCVLVLGEEKHGMPARLLAELDRCVEIPQLGLTRSLNVHVSASIAVWEHTRRILAQLP